MSTVEPPKSVGRTVPIADTIAPIAGYPDTLKIFKIAASRFWQVRVYREGRMFKRSTKTESKREATEFAKRFYEDTLIRIRQDLPVEKCPTVDKVALEMMEYDQGLVDAGLRSEYLVRDQKQHFRKYVVPYFGGTRVEDVTYRKLHQYVSHLRQAKLSAQSIHAQLVFVRKILKYAHKMDMLDRLPIFPSVERKKGEHKPRGWFTKEEYLQLRKAAARLAHDKRKIRGTIITMELRDLIVFLVHSFLRPTDARFLKNKHVEIVEGAEQYLRITTEHAKTVHTPVVTMPHAVVIYKKLLRDRTEEGYGKPDDYVFMPQFQNRRHAWDMLGRQFNAVLEETNLKVSPLGEPRTLYSLRHTAIMFRLLWGDAGVFLLAKACRTSVQMIEDHYARHLTPEMNVQRLQSMRPTAPAKKDTSKPGAKAPKEADSAAESA